MEPFLRLATDDVKDGVLHISEGRRKTCVDADEDSPHEDHDDDDDGYDGEEDQAPDLKLLLKAAKLSVWKMMQVFIYACRSTYPLHHCKRCRSQYF